MKGTNRREDTHCRKVMVSRLRDMGAGRWGSGEGKRVRLEMEEENSPRRSGIHCRTQLQAPI